MRDVTPIAPTRERLFLNPRRRSPSVAATSAASSIEFHRSFPSYRPTPLLSVPSLATPTATRLFVKDESSRLGLPAFKILGASYAIYLQLCARLGRDPSSVRTLADLVQAVEAARLINSIRDARLDLTIHAATDGNHGRACSHVASLLNLPSRIVVPAAVSQRSRDFIASEPKAVVCVHDGSYDDAVAAAALAANQDGEKGMLIQDTSFEGYEEVPMQIIQGYRTLFTEIDEQLAESGQGKGRPLVLCVPVGVGSLCHAAAVHYATSQDTIILSVEPTAAPCLLTSLLSGTPRPITTSHTVCAGLCCGTVSSLAWNDLKNRVDAAVAVDDVETIKAFRELKALGVDSGPCGAATLAGWRLFQSQSGMDLNAATVVLISTESGEVYGVS